MIGKLTGRVDEVSADHALIDVNGVGYIAFCGAGTLAKLVRGDFVSLHIETQVREDAIRLFGFATVDERDWFRLLQTVQGVGAKVALAVLSIAAPSEISRSIALQDKSLIGRAAGVGPARGAYRFGVEGQGSGDDRAAAASGGGRTRAGARSSRSGGGGGLGARQSRLRASRSRGRGDGGLGGAWRAGETRRSHP